MQQQLQQHKVCHPELAEGSQQRQITKTINKRNYATTTTTTRSLSLLRQSEQSSRARRNLKIQSISFYILYSIFLTLLSIPATAQNYQWDWAINGGSNNGKDYWRYDIEQMYDVVVGSDDNYYYLASINRSSIGSAASQLAGQPVTVYNSYDPNVLDIFLFSTTCDGQVRWSQAIGGGGGLTGHIK